VGEAEAKANAPIGVLALHLVGFDTVQWIAQL
jgi:hypothetical protein